MTIKELRDDVPDQRCPHGFRIKVGRPCSYCAATGGERPMDYLHPLETFRADSRDTRADADLFAITNAELSRAVTLFHELDVKRKQGMTTANMLRVILTDLLASRAASVPEDS